MLLIHYLPRETRSLWQAPSPSLPGSGTSSFFHVETETNKNDKIILMERTAINKPWKNFFHK